MVPIKLLASHRFRQRRKEKEEETSDSISKLEAQVREMTEEKEYYQQERENATTSAISSSNQAIPCDSTALNAIQSTMAFCLSVMYL